MTEKAISFCTRRSCRFNRALSVIAVNLFIMAVLLVLLEWGLRARSNRQEDDSWHLEPTFSYYEMFTLRPYTSQNYNVEIVPGVTTRRLNPCNPASGKTVYMFGGSTMAGERRPDDDANSDGDTIAAHLSKISVSNEFPLICYNYGVPNYRTNEELVKLVKLLRAGHRPDYVVFYDGYNDSQFALNGQICYDVLKPMEAAYERDAARENVSSLLDRVLIIRQLPVPGFKQALANTLSKMFFSKAYQSDYVRIDEVDLSDYASKTNYCVSTYSENILMVELLGEAYGFKPLFVLQPMLYFKQEMSEEEADIYKEIPDHLKEGTPAIYSNIIARFKGDGSLLSAVDVFDGVSDTVYIDQGHMLSDGNRQVADYIFNAIKAVEAGK